MKSIGYFPGCSLGGTAFEYAKSLAAVASRLEYELKEVPEWICCGATSAHAVDHTAALCMAADTLAKARRAGMEQVLAPCAMCYQRLAVASAEMARQPGLSGKLAAAMGEKPDFGLDQVKAMSILAWLGQVPVEQIKAAVTKPLKGLKVACYYGCLLVRPAKVTGVENVETPRDMEKIVTALGGEAVRWSMATECCGASFALSKKDAVLRLSQRICESARKAGAEIICLACPMCHANLDMRQAQFANPGGSAIPIVYLTQLMGTAFGLGAEELGLRSHFVAAEAVLAR